MYSFNERFAERLIAATIYGKLLISYFARRGLLVPHFCRLEKATAGAVLQGSEDQIVVSSCLVGAFLAVPRKTNVLDVWAHVDGYGMDPTLVDATRRLVEDFWLDAEARQSRVIHWHVQDRVWLSAIEEQQAA